MSQEKFSDICVKFYFQGGEHEFEDFHACDVNLLDTVKSRGREMSEELGYGPIDRFEVVEFDEAWLDPADFESLNEYGEYACCIEEYGTAYHFRYLDIGENNFEDDYYGCYRDMEDFCIDFVNQNCDIPRLVDSYINYDLMARDGITGFSTYVDNHCIYVFQD